MNLRDIDIPKLFFFLKFATARPVDFKIKVGKWHKVMSDRRIGFFGWIWVTHTAIMKIGDFDSETLALLGYSSIEEYLAEPFNKGLTVESEKKVIYWDRFMPIEDRCLQIMQKKQLWQMLG